MTSYPHKNHCSKFNFRKMEVNVQTNNKLQLIEQAYGIFRDPIKRNVYDTCKICKSRKIGYLLKSEIK